MLGIIGAMDEEVLEIKNALKDVTVETAAGMDFYRGKINEKEVVVVRSGIGKVNAAIGALSLVDTFHPSMVINTGVAGGTGAGNPPAEVLDLVLATEIAYHDVWCGPGTERGQAAGYPARFECPLPADIRAALGAKGGLLASGDIFVDDPADLKRILSLYPDAVAVDMESAAIAQVCALKDVPFVCLRVVSDTPGEGGNIAAYNNFWTDAPARTFASVVKLLELL